MSIDVEPTWYIYSMHFTAFVTTPVNFMGVFIILCCQKSQLKSLRWHLLIYQICSMVTDFLINIGSLPVIYSPFPIGRPHGVFTKVFQYFGFPTSTEAQCIMVFVSLYITAGSVEFLFFLRYQAILPHNHPHKLSIFVSIFIVAIYQIFLIIMMVISFRSAVPDQNKAREQFATLYPELQYLVIDEHVYFLCVIVELVHVVFLFSCFFRLGIGIITVFSLIWMSHGALHRFDLSTKTRRIHLQLIRSLCYQISVPIVAFYGPLLVVVCPLMFTIPNSQGTVILQFAYSIHVTVSFFISLICISVHTFLGTLSMLYFNSHYRHWLLSAIKNKSLATSTPISKIMLVRENINVSRIPSKMF